MGRLEQIAKGQDLDNGVLPRRSFLVGASSLGLMFGFARNADAAQSLSKNPAFQAAAFPGPEFEPNIWCSVGADGIVNVNIIRAEMGQHVGTSLARIMADEMEADWDKIRVTYVDTDPKWGLMVTGGSWSVWMTWDVFRQAGAAARTVFIDEGAKLLGVAPSACMARNGMISAGNMSISYGDIVAKAKPTRQFTADEMAKLPLKPASERRLIGKDVPALDVGIKTTGAAVYGIDAVIEGMVYARPKMPPTRYGSKVLSVDDTQSRTVRGYLRHIIVEDPSGTVPGWVVVVADTYPATVRATDLLKVEWTPGDAINVSEADILDHGRALILNKDTGTLVFNDAGVDAAFGTAASVIERDYTCASVLHFQLEPLNALVRLHDGIWEIHCGNQWQSLSLPVIAQALGVDQSKVVMKSYMLGGGFGRRLNGDYAVPAALVSKALGGKPVKLIFTRADDVMFDSIRSPSVQKTRVAVDANGKFIGMEHHATAGWPTLVMAPVAMSKGVDGKPYDQFSLSGADSWYDCGPMRVRAINNDLADATFRPGWLRSVSAGWTSWAAESFWEEVAFEMKRDPVQMRIDMLNGEGPNGRNKGQAPNSVGGALRQAAVLKRLAEKCGWSERGTLPKDTGLGIATTFGQERGMPTWTAAAAQVHVDRKTGVVSCTRLWLVLDAGTIVHPDGALAQTEGGALWGLSMVLCEGSTIVNGTVVDRNLDTYTPLRMPQVPDIDVEFIPSTEKPTGLGEPGVTAIGPAVGNAIFHAVGVRLRHQPIRPNDVLAALNTLSDHKG